jgi:ArsR family transcriptional regulator
MEHIEPTANDEQLAILFHALGNSVRLALLRYIAHHPGCICNDLVLRFNRAQATMSQHLAILRKANLLRVKQDGNATCYWLDSERLAWTCNQLHSIDQFADQQGAKFDDQA